MALSPEVLAQTLTNPAPLWSPTLRLRWLLLPSGICLQQEWRDHASMATEWRAIDAVKLDQDGAPVTLPNVTERGPGNVTQAPPGEAKPAGSDAIG